MRRPLSVSYQNSIFLRFRFKYNQDIIKTKKSKAQFSNKPQIKNDFVGVGTDRSVVQSSSPPSVLARGQRPLLGFAALFVGV